MTFVDSIQQLQFYSGGQCYCERLMALSDFYLYGELPAAGATVEIEVLSADGLTSYEGAGVEGNGTVLGLQMTYGSSGGKNFFQLTAERWAQVFCEHPCFVLHIVIQAASGAVIFNKYTQLYCLDGCCTVPGGVVVNGQSTEPVDTGGSSSGTVTDGTANDCGRRTFTLTAEYDCDDVFAEMLGISNGATVQKSINLEGLVKKLPVEITRTIAKCRIQKTEVTQKYEVQISEPLPEWKKDELELMLTAPRLYLNGFLMIYTGGTPFTELFTCSGLFKGRFQVEECTVSQRYGCGIPCADSTSSNKAYYGFKKSADVYRDDKGVVMAYTLEKAADFLRYRTGVTAVSLHDYEAVGEDAAYIEVTGAKASLPSFLYAGAPVAANRIMKRLLPDFSAPEVFGIPRDFILCPRPVMDGEATFTDEVCEAPTVTADPVFFETCPMPQKQSATFFNSN